MKAGVRGLTLVSSRPKKFQNFLQIFSSLLVVMMVLVATITPILNPNFHHQVLT